MAATALGSRIRGSGLRPPLRGADDQRIVARVRAGDDAAFEVIYDRYARGLLSFCRQMLASRDEAEDALQQSFGAAYRMLRSSDKDVELRPWLYTIARNRCLSLLRSRRKDISLEVAPDFGIVDGLTDEVQRRSDLRELLEDLRGLPDDQRAALVLFEFGGLPHEEIATVLDVRRDKVKALIFQAREGLVRSRRARELPCTEMREQLASLAGKVPGRSMLRRHIDRCPSCALFEAEVGRQRVGLALILPVLPTAGLKSVVLGSAIGHGAFVAGGGAGAGGAAVLGSAGGGGGLACAGASTGAAGLAGAGAGAGAATSGGILAGAAAGGVSGTLATAGSAGTIAAAIGAKGAGGVVVKLLAVAVLGGGVAGTADIGRQVAAAVRPPATHQDAASAVGPSPVIEELLAPADPPATDAPAVTPAAAHGPLPPTASDPALVPTATTQTASGVTGGAPIAPIAGLPAANSGVPPAPATSHSVAAVQPDATSDAPPTTTPPPATTTTAGIPGDASPTQTATPTAAPAPDAGDGPGAPAAGAGSAPGGDTAGPAPAPAPAADVTPAAVTTPAPDALATTPAKEPAAP